MAKQRVAIALSGGVDSSAAAVLLKEAGYDVTGISMHLWNEKGHKPENQPHSCGCAENIHDAEETCHVLGIPFHSLDLEDEFQRYVIDYFCEEYARGRTPNPCIKCNQDIKFGFLLRQALFLGADYLATGHYARIECSEGSHHLLKAKDSTKDQSYVLYTLEQSQLKHLLFPLGNYHKDDARRLAKERGLPTANKTSSQDICFIKDDYRTFLSHLLPVTPGETIDRQGNVLGQHKGTAFYTIGQRHDLGLVADERLYVTGIEHETNRITVGTEEELYGEELTATQIKWVPGESPPRPIEVSAKIRYKSPEVAATVFPQQDFAEVRFHHPQRAIAPGQAIVFYRENEVIGGGTIDSYRPTPHYHQTQESPAIRH